MLAGTVGVPGSIDGPGGMASFRFPQGVAVDGAGNVYVADTNNCIIRKITPTGVVSTLAGTATMCSSAEGTGGVARFNIPRGIAVDGSGNLYVADTNNCTIRKVVPSGVVGTASTLAGTAGMRMSAAGSSSVARFNAPQGITSDGSGTLYV